MQNQEKSDLLKFNTQLIQYPSVTPNESGSLDFIEAHLVELGFSTKRYNRNQTSNLFAYRSKHSRLLFCGHVDVVPPGPVESWTHPPFSGHISDNRIYGRGAVDMKSSISAFVCALSRISPYEPSTAILLTSDEEGEAKDGVQFAIERIHAEGYLFDQALVGEPTSVDKLGDTIKIGRRGSLTGILYLHGKPGHVAYHHLAQNPIPAACKIITSCSEKAWDQASEYFPQTSCVCTTLSSKSLAGNMTPSDCHIQINFRYAPGLTAENIQESTEHIIQKNWDAPYTLSWHISAQPFLSTVGSLYDSMVKAIYTITHNKATLSTSGGTSDARFLHAYINEIVELGPLNATAHQVDEHIPIEDLVSLSEIYETLLRHLR